jgi:hypothetical protein
LTSEKSTRIKIFFAVILALTTTAWVAQRFYIITYTPAAMKTFSTKIRTHCLGRFLINLPEDLGNPSITFAMLYFGLGADFKTVEVRMPEDEDISRVIFDHRVAAWRNELKSTFNSEVGAAMLLTEENVETPNGPAVLIRRLDSADMHDSTVQSELHVFVKGRYVILAAESFPPESSFNNHAKDIYKLANPEAAEKRLVRVAQQLIRITDPERAGPGFCLNGVLIDQWHASYDEEKVTFRFNDSTDLQPKLNISMDGAFGYESETLHDRMARMMHGLPGSQDEIILREIRKTDQQIGGMQFQEWAHETYRKKSNATEYTFVAQNLAPAEMDKRLERPSTSILLVSGDRKSSSPYSLRQMENAWDTWLSTFRLTPGNGGKQK